MIVAKYLDAAKKAGFESLFSIVALDPTGMTAMPCPTSAAVKKLLALMVAQDNSLKIDNEVDLRITMQLAYAASSAHAKACAPPPAAAAAPAAATPSSAATAEKEKAAAAAFGLKAYTNVEALTLDEIEPKYRATGKQVKALRDGWNSGAMIPESYKLNLQQSVLTLEEEKTTSLTSDLQLTLSAPPKDVSMKRNGEFLTQLRIFKGKVLAAGMVPVPNPPIPESPCRVCE